MIETAFFGAYTLGQFMIGFLVRYLDTKTYFTLDLLLSAAGVALFAYSQSQAAFLIGWAINGFWQASAHTLCTNYLADIFPRDRRNVIMACGIRACMHWRRVGERYGDMGAASHH